MSIELMKRTIVETCREFYHSFNLLQNKDPKQSVHQEARTLKLEANSYFVLTKITLIAALITIVKVHKGG